MRFSLLFWLVLLPLFTFPARAAGQALPFFPDPILVEDVEAWREHLDLSNEQFRAVLRLHEQYREEFADLRISVIQQFQDTITEMVPRFSGMMFGDVQIPPRQELDEVLRRSRQVTSGITAVDREFFDQVEELLTSQQVDQLEIQILTRDMEHFQISRMMISNLNRGLRLDVTPLLLGLELDSNDRAMAEKALLDHLRAVLPRARRMHSDLYSIAEIVLDLIEELNLREMAPEEMMMLGMDADLVTRLKNLFDESTRVLQENASRITKGQLEMMKKLMRDLDEEAAETIRRRGLRRAYPRVMGRYVRMAERLDSAEEMDTDKERIGLIHGVREEVKSSIHPMLLKLADLRENEREYRTVDQLESRTWPEAETFEKLQERKQSILDQAQTSLDGIVGTEQVDEPVELVTRPSRRYSRDEGSGGGGRASARRARERLEAEPDQETGYRPRLSWVAQPISVGDIRLISSILDADPSESPLIDVIYDQYRDSYESLLDDIARRALAIDEDDDEGFADLVNSAKEEVVKLDDEFFNDIALSNTKWYLSGRLRLFSAAWGRARTVDQFGLSAFMDAGGNHEPKTDLVLVVSEGTNTTLTSSGEDSIWRQLEEYSSKAERLMEALEEIQDKYRSMQRTMEGWSGRRNTDADRQIAQTIRRKLNDTVGDLRDGASDLVNLNRKTLDSIESTISEDDAVVFRRMYEEAAYPSVFQDREAVFDEIEDARAVAGLSPVELSDLDEILVRYRMAYDDICSQMVTVQSNANWGRPEEGMIGSEDVDLLLDLEKLKFQRREINSAALAEVKAVLGVEQFQEIFRDS